MRSFASDGQSDGRSSKGYAFYDFFAYCIIEEYATFKAKIFFIQGSFIRMSVAQVIKKDGFETLQNDSSDNWVQFKERRNPKQITN